MQPKLNINKIRQGLGSMLLSPEEAIDIVEAAIIRDTGLIMTIPASDTDKPIGETWPEDALHEAAREVVRGAKDLVPRARKAVSDATAASKPLSGRAAQDHALGRALRYPF
jgi:hypothetical protein